MPNLYGKHFIHWTLGDILSEVERNPMRVFEVIKIDFHNPLESIVAQHCEG